MATLTTTRGYDDGEVLLKSHLDAFLDDIETFINTTKISDDNIQNSGITGSTKLLNQSVTAAKLAADSVTTLKIADGSVTTAKLADDGVTTAKIAAGAVTTTELGALAVTTAKIAAGAVTTTELGATAVTTAKIAAGAVTATELGSSAVTTAKINDGAVTPVKKSTNFLLTEIAYSNSSAADINEVESVGTLTTTGRLVRYIWKGQIVEAQVGAGKSRSVDIYFARHKTSDIQSGTYTRSSSTVTVSLTAHGYNTNDWVYFNATSGTATDGLYKITVSDADTFTFTHHASGSITSNSCDIYRPTMVQTLLDSALNDTDTLTIGSNPSTISFSNHYGYVWYDTPAAGDWIYNIYINLNTIAAGTYTNTIDATILMEEL